MPFSPADATRPHAPPRSFTIGNQTFPGRKFRRACPLPACARWRAVDVSSCIACHCTDYRTLNYALSSNVIVFFYSFWMIIADALRMSGR